MDTTILIETFGKIAGIGGVGLGVCLLVFRDVVAKRIFPRLSQEQAFHLLRMVITFTFILGLAGIAAWAWANPLPSPPVKKWPTAFEDIRTAELIVSDVDDELIISVNDREVQRLRFGEVPSPIPITSLLHRGSNKLTFLVLNGPYGGCGAEVSVNLNGLANPDFAWSWFKDIDKACANCNCFTFNKTLYLQ